MKDTIFLTLLFFKFVWRHLDIVGCIIAGPTFILETYRSKCWKGRSYFFQKFVWRHVNYQCKVVLNLVRRSFLELTDQNVESGELIFQKLCDVIWTYHIKLCWTRSDVPSWNLQIVTSLRISFSFESRIVVRLDPADPIRTSLPYRHDDAEKKNWIKKHI